MILSIGTHTLRLTLLILWLFLATSAWSAPTPQVRFPDGDLAYAQTDLSVAVRGGSVVLSRTWADGRWYLNPAWADLKLSLDAVDGSVRSIQRGGTVFAKSGNDVFVDDDRYFIRATTAPVGWRWYDRIGNWIDYDATGRITRYGDRNDVQVSFTRNSNGQIESVRDHAGAVALTLTWNGDHVATARDRDNREVVYSWSGGLLNQVTDVLGYHWSYLYDGNGQLTTITDPEDRVWQITYVQSFRVSGSTATPGVSTSGRVARDFRVSPVWKLKNPLNKETVYEYDYSRDRRQWSVVEHSPAGRRIERVYEITGRLVKQEDGDAQTYLRTLDGPRVEILRDERGLLTRRELDSYRNPLRIIYPDGSSESWTYHAQFSFPVEHIDARGTRTTWQYDAKGNLTERVVAAGSPEAQRTTYVYNAFGELTKMTIAGATPAEDASTDYEYDAFGNLNKITDAEGKIVSRTHDGMGKVLTETDARGKVWTWTYNARGEVLTQADPINPPTTHTYNKVGNRKTTTDPTGATTTYTYDGADRLLTTTDDEAGVSTMTYDDDGRVIRQEDPSGQFTTYGYDTRGRMTTVTDAAGNITHTVYGTTSNGLEGLIAAMEYPSHREEYKYDSRDRRTQIIRILPAVGNTPERREITISAYDAVGNLIASTDALGRSTLNTYDGRRRLTESTDALGGKTRYAYDTRDNLLSLTDANDHTHRFTFDKRNRTLTEARPLGQTIRYVYDANGNLIERIDPLNQRAVYRYDDANRRDQAEYFEAGATTAHKTVSFSFDERNLLTGYDDGTTSAVYVYDDLGRKTSETVDYGNFSLGHSYSYFANGQKQSYTAPDGTVISYAYTYHGQLERLTIPDEGDIVYSSFKWTRPQTITYPGNTIRNLSYDALMRTQTIQVRISQNQLLMDYGYDYDAVGNITEKRTEYGAFRYQYDALDRLTGADYPNGPQNDQINDSFAPNTFPFADDHYSYDLIGNRQSDLAQTADTPWQYNGNNELLNAGFAAFDYNAAGSTIAERDPQTEAITRSYRYNTEERLSEVRNAADQTIASYYYDPLGRRLWKTLQPGAEGHSGAAGPETTYLAYSDEGYAAEFTLPGTPADAPTTGPNAGQFSNVWVFAPERIWSTDPIASKTSGGWRYLQTDHLGTPQLTITSTGTTNSQLRIAAFGNTREQGELQALRFAGQVSDREVGTHYNFRRTYDPANGRFQQRDPLFESLLFDRSEGEATDTSEYAITRLNPLKLVDEEGLVSIEIGRSCNSLRGKPAYKRLVAAAEEAASNASLAPSCDGNGKSKYTIKCGKCGGNCGRSIPNFGRICVNMDQVDAGGCGSGPKCLESSILHETVHRCGQGNEIEPYACEKRFYSETCRFKTPEKYEPKCPRDKPCGG
jgi:RHS repeat-associated protein